MAKRGLVALAALAMLIAFPSAASQVQSPAQVEPPIELDAFRSEAGTGTALLQNGTASIAFSVGNGSLDVWTKRIPCIDRSPDTCTGSGSTTQRSLDATGATVSLSPRPNAQDTHRTLLIASPTTSIGLDANDGNATLRNQAETITLTEASGAPEDMAQATLTKGADIHAPNGSDLALNGNIDFVTIASTITVNDGQNTKKITTGWSWDQAEGAGIYQWYRNLTLVRASLDAVLAASWNGNVQLAAQTPVLLEADQATLTLAQGTLEQTTPDDGETTIEDFDATITGIRWNRAKTDNSGPQTYQPQQSADGPVGWFLVEQGTTPATPAPPTDTTDASVSAQTVYTGTATALVLAGIAAYYWPRISWVATVTVLPLYSRIEKDEILDHDVRETLYEAVQDDPGIHAHALAEAANVGWGTTVYHLRRLERNGFVNSEKRGRYRRFFPASGFLENQREVLSVLQNETTNAIARLILREPGLNQKAICDQLDISPSLANWHLNRLIDAELVDRERQGRTVHYTPGSAWRSIKDAVDMDVADALGDEPVPA